MGIKSLIAAAIVVFVSGCPLHNPPPVEPEYPPPTPFFGDPVGMCASACTNLRRLACPEGFGAISGETCERRCVVALELRSMPLECWIRADDVASARGCGSLRCLR